MDRQLTFLYPVIAILALGAVAWFGLADTGATWNIGIIGPLTGTASPYGIGQRNGAKLAIDQINAAGGINGRRISGMFIDDANEKVKAAEVARELIYRQGVHLILGSISSDNTMNLQRLCERAQVPLLTSVSTNPFITRVNFAYTFRCLSDDDVQARELANYTTGKLNLRRVAILHDANKYGSQGARTYATIARSLGQTIVTNESYDGGSTNFRIQLERIKAANPDGLLIWGLVNESALAARQARELGLNMPIFGGDGMAPDAFLYLAGMAAEGTVLTFPFDPLRGGDLARKFSSEYRQAFGQPPDSFAAHAYDGIMLLAQAIRTSDGTTAGIRDALARINEYQGVTGKGGFDASGNETRPVQLARVQNGAFIPLTTGENR